MAIAFDGAILVPAADPDDGEATARALAPRLGPESEILIVHVIEKGGGAPDKAPLESRKEYAQQVFGRTRAPLEDTGATIETEILYGTDVVETIYESGAERKAEAVAFVPRKANRLMEMLSGNTTRRMIREATLPVIVLPVNDVE
ncbi:universal stress protein [Natrialbaceae archaeon A-CW2]|uniref:universal stress protein n=1 Tax=Natronosalvus amylolyticus TaxID=2961994 RepID=UPI0020C9F38F|nr:universal stress protein [Natronosalvus amylolyticus]